MRKANETISPEVCALVAGIELSSVVTIIDVSSSMLSMVAVCFLKFIFFTSFFRKLICYNV